MSGAARSEAPKRSRSLLQRLGGRAAVSAVSDILGEKLREDARLAELFAGTDWDRLTGMHASFLTAALGSGRGYRGKDMRRAHAHLAIEDAHFDRVAELLRDSLVEAGVGEPLLGEVLSAVAALRPQIVVEPESSEGSPKMKQAKARGDAADGADHDSGVQRIPEAAGRYQSMLENAPINVVYADTDMVIRYVNPASVRTLQSLAEYLPIRVDDIVGSSIDVFHKHPEHQRKIVRDPSNLPHRATISLGPEKLELLVTAIYDEEGEHTGAMVTWEVVTKKLALERRAAQVMSMVENSSTNMIYADTDFVIQYVNPASVATLRSLEEYLPCRADEMVGQSIDIFHKHPEHQRAMLRDPSRLPHRATISLGPEKLELYVTAIYDDRGEYVGPMVTWDVVTKKLQLESEMARVMSMMEQAPINVMYCDTDFVIQYANPASINTLRGLESHLPIRVDDLVGSSIDVFHKNPRHQRRLLADPSNLPHSAQIGVGPETLDLRVSAIYDNEGAYLGAMVTWEVITEKLASEQRARELQEREREAAQTLRDKVNSMLANVSAAAEGDLTQAVTVSGDDAIGQMGEGLAGFLSDLRETVRGIGGNSSSVGQSSGELLSVAQSMAATAEETSHQARVVTAAAEEVSENVQTVAAGIEELNASVKEIAKNAADAASVATEGVTVAESTNASVAKLGDSSTEIGKVIKVITSIAQQTNLLALNATIEAARAGEAGKGFAVVANEVKELAKETAKATEDIGQKIEAIQSDTRNAVTAIDRISEIISQVNEIQSTIAAAVEEQTATTNEIARNVAEAARGSNEIAANISSVAEAAQSTAEGAAATQTAAEQLGTMSRELNEVVGKFKV